MTIKERGERDWLILLSRLMLGSFGDVKREFTKICEMGYIPALKLWYKIFSEGDNLYIDDMVDNFPDLTRNQIGALGRSLAPMIREARHDKDAKTRLERGMLMIDKASIRLNKCEHVPTVNPKQTFIDGLDKKFSCLDHQDTGAIFDKWLSEIYKDFDGKEFFNIEISILFDLILQHCSNSRELTRHMVVYLKKVAQEEYSDELNNYELKGSTADQSDGATAE